MRFILASKSPRRKEILQNIGLDFEIIPAVGEEVSEEIEPEKYAAGLAFEKAEEVWSNNRKSLVIGADTIVVCDNEILGKPANSEQAVNFLEMLSGRSHRVITGVAICSENIRAYDFSVTKVFFRDLSETEIRKYIQSMEWTDKAGAYGIQGHASLFIEKIDGCYFNVVGFPVNTFYSLLERNNIDLKEFLKWS